MEEDLMTMDQFCANLLRVPVVEYIEKIEKVPILTMGLIIEGLLSNNGEKIKIAVELYKEHTKDM